MNNREKVLKYGIEVFNKDLDKFSNWLLKSNTFLEGKTPNELLLTSEGIIKVKNCLERINFANFS